MSALLVLALLANVSGNVLLARRRDSSLWSVPGAVLRARTVSRMEYLAACCRRQVGVTPVFVAPLVTVDLAGITAMIGVDEVPADSVRACGRVGETKWFSPDALPVDLAPVARLAIATHFQRRSATLLERRALEPQLAPVEAC